MARILVIAPQPDELQHLLEGIAREGCKYEPVKFGSIEGANARELGLTIAVGGHGKAQFAAQTQYLLSHVPDAEMVICAGAAGALAENLSLGDVIVSTGTVEHDYRLRFVSRPSPVHQVHEPSIEQIQQSAITADLSFSVHFGRIASGDEDIVDRERAVELRDATNALCVAWEGSGGARAAALNELPFLELRAITDTADHLAASDFEQNLAKTIPNIGSLLVRWLCDGTA